MCTVRCDVKYRNTEIVKRIAKRENIIKEGNFRICRFFFCLSYVG